MHSERSSVPSKKPDGDKPSSEFHRNLSQCLRDSEELKPLHLEVHNDSIWNYNRQRLGIKRHSLISVKYNASNLRFEGFIYDLKRRQEDLEIVPMKTHVSTATTKWMAFKQAEQAQRERDSFRPIVDDSLIFTEGASHVHESKRSGLVLDTHFRIVVVSEKFYRMSALDRIQLVCHSLNHSALGVHSDPHNHDRSCFQSAPVRMKMASTFGENMCKLELFWFLPSASAERRTELIIQAMTPAQWRPEIYKPLISERLGKAHKEVHALQISQSVKAAGQRTRLKKLTTEVHASSGVGEGSVVTGGMSSSESIASGSIQHSQSMSQLPTARELDDELNEHQQQQNQQHSPPADNVTHRSTVASPPGGNKKRKADVNLGETLGLDSSVSGVRYQKLGGIYGHFFNDLSDDVRGMVLQRYKDNKELIRTLPAPEPVPLGMKRPSHQEDDFQPRTNLQRLRKKAQENSQLGDVDAGTGSQAEMRDDVLISNRRIELMAIRLQRLRRLHLLYRARRRSWRREYGALTIQRFLRGRFARQFVQIYRRLQPIAAVRIQRFYRIFIEKRVLVSWWYLTRRLTRFVLPKIKRFIRNCFLSWIAKREANAVIIQKYVRRRVVYVKWIKLRAMVFLYRQVFPQAAMHIQRAFRGHRGRLRFHRLLLRKLVLMVDVPAALRIQRIFRGRRAKKVLERLRYEHRCLLRLQHWVKRTVRRIWDEELRRQRRIKAAVIAIQRTYRGHYDRHIYKLIYHKYWYEHVFLPAVLLVQCHIRRYRAQCFVYEKKTRWRAARVIQRSFRYHVRYEKTKAQRKALVRARFEKNAVILQKNLRRFLARRKYHARLMGYRGQVTLAAKIIMRAWRSYKLQEKYELLLTENRKVNERRAYEAVAQVAKEVQQDVREAYQDVQLTIKSRDRYKERLQQVDEFLSQSALRLINIKKEMTQLTMEDFERGWAEALGQEYEYIVHQQQMAREESRLMRHRMKVLSDELLALQLEIEENEIELDKMDQRCVEILDRVRVREIQDQVRKAERNMRRLVYREKTHWKIRTNRAKKMLGARSSYHRLVKEAEAARPLLYATTVSYEKRQRLRDYEEFSIAEQLEIEARHLDEASKPSTYEVYAQPAQRTFDDAVASSLAVLRGFTLDDRAANLQRQYQSESDMQKRLQRGQFAPLKPDFVMPGINQGL